jgi:hypothetical protein
MTLFLLLQLPLTCVGGEVGEEPLQDLALGVHLLQGRRRVPVSIENTKG